MALSLFGALAGLTLGYVLQRSQLCFHATFAGLYARRFLLARTWALGVAIAMVGLTGLYAATSPSDVNRGLAFDPVHNVVGGLLIGVGMVVAMSCVSGLYFKLGSGMLGATVGLVGWAAGEAVVRDWVLPGSDVVLGFGDEATIPGWLGIPRWTVAVPIAAAVVAYLFRRRLDERPAKDWQWDWRIGGVALGAVTILAWWLAAIPDGRDFGPSTVGTVAAIVDGQDFDRWAWQFAFLVAMIPGAFAAARLHGGLWVRGEPTMRYAGLAGGGFLLGAGGRIGGGCNLGHGLSGVAQLNVSSWVVVASLIAGIGVGRAVQTMLTSRGPGLPPELRPTPAAR